MSNPEREEMDHAEEVIFSESETKDQSKPKLAEVSPKTKQFLQENYTQRVPNTESCKKAGKKIKLESVAHIKILTHQEASHFFLDTVKLLYNTTVGSESS